MAAAEVERETEAKLGAGVGLDLAALDLSGAELPPEARGLAVGPAEHTELDAWYFDTEDLRLARRGITLRRRRQHHPLAAPGLDAPATWTLKLPAAAPTGAAGLDRDELSMSEGALPAPAWADDPGAPPPPEAIPEELSRLVTAFVRRAPLVAVARLVTDRAVHPLATPDGHRWGEIDDDRVTVHLPAVGDGGTAAPPAAEARFRELEVELAPGAPPPLLDAVVGALQDAGAGAADPTPKLVRALGPRAGAPPELSGPAPGAKATLAEVVAAGLARSVRQLIEHDPVIRLDADPEGVHQARVSTRRLRSDLRTYRGVLEPGWVDPLRRELAWLGGELGVVRDADVLLVRLAAAVATLDDGTDSDAGAALVERLRAERRRALDRLQARLSSHRYTRLLDRLVEAAEAPPVVFSGERRASKVLPRLVRKPWRRAAREARRLARATRRGGGQAPADSELHQLRILVKRARYAVDLAAPVVGEPADALYRRLGQLQDELGDMQDTVVAEAWLRKAATGRAQPLVAGLLIADLRRERAAHRRAWPRRWKAANRRRLVSWIP